MNEEVEATSLPLSFGWFAVESEETQRSRHIEAEITRDRCDHRMFANCLLFSMFSGTATWDLFIQAITMPGSRATPSTSCFVRADDV